MGEEECCGCCYIYGWRSPLRDLQIEALSLTAKVRCVIETSAGRGTRAASRLGHRSKRLSSYQYPSGMNGKREGDVQVVTSTERIGGCFALVIAAIS